MPQRLTGVLYVATVVAGVVDAVSFLGLGRVFVANMTGNIVFVGFGIASAPGISVIRSLGALVAFLLGSAAGGWLARRLGERRRIWLPLSFGAECACFALALGLDAGNVVRSGGPQHLALIVPMAAGMGLQNAAANELALPDLTTTVLTRTLTGLASSLARARLDWAQLGRRLLAVAAMLVGASVGALLVLRVALGAGLALAVGLLALAALAATIAEEEAGRGG